jgi:hypothetical protein
MIAPSASAIVISPDGFHAVSRLVASLRRQSGAGRLELVFVFPPGAAMPTSDALSGFAAHRFVEIPAMNSTARARAAGIRAASAPIVILTEDHCFPEDGWLEALISAHSGGWTVAGPSIANGNPGSLLSWANLAIEYNEWFHPASRGPVDHLPGHNSSYSRDVLLSFGPALDEWLEAESVLHWDLRARGHRLLLESNAVVRHHNFSLWRDSLALRFNAGQQFAGMCRLRWSIARRILYLGGAPLIPLVRAFRIARQLLRPGRPSHLLPRLLPLCLFLLYVETAGAFMGYLTGAGAASRRITAVDFNRDRHMNSSDREIWNS